MTGYAGPGVHPCLSPEVTVVVAAAAAFEQLGIHAAARQQINIIEPARASDQLAPGYPP